MAVKGTESGSSENFLLEIVDIPMLAVVRHFNRLGLVTISSCAGHKDENSRRNKYAYIEFKSPTSGLLASELVAGLGYMSNLQNIGTIQIQGDHSSLFELGLELSKIPGTDSLRNQLLEKREIFLEELLMIPGKTGSEAKVQAYLLNIIPGLMGEVRQDDTGNILVTRRFGFGPTIMLSAHMDIKDELPEESYLIKDGKIWRRNLGILGADDRAGVAIILNICKVLSSFNFRGQIKIVFTVSEEDGQYGAEKIDPAFYSDVDFAISLDRKNGADIISHSTTQLYCDEEYGKVFEDASHDLWNGNYPFKTTKGGISDLRVWSQAGVPSVNLSIGYYNEHTPQEYLNLEEWHRTHDLVLHAIEMLAIKFRREKRNLPKASTQP